MIQTFTKSINLVTVTLRDENPHGVQTWGAAAEEARKHNVKAKGLYQHGEMARAGKADRAVNCQSSETRLTVRLQVSPSRTHRGTGWGDRARRDKLK